jgi:RIO-like serine/threonine protein kinase
MNHNALQRQQILEILYTVRETSPKRGWLAESKLKEAMEGKDMEFALDVLIELDHVTKEGYQLTITGAGVLACEATQQ